MSFKPLKDLITSLSEDDWRRHNAFTPEMISAQERISAAKSGEVVRGILLEWIAQHQPCLFGRMAARLEALGTCVIFEHEILENTDEWVVAHVDAARRKWLASAFLGASSGFVFAVISDKIAYGEPNQAMFELAARLCSYYLARGDIERDQVYLDEAFLTVGIGSPMTWKWLAGVNYFCANGDGRWWRDHRIPGGLAFSTNSVGHLVKSGLLRNAKEEFFEKLGIEATGDHTPIDSLPKALRLAMQTIYLASDGLSGKATELVKKSADTPPPPIELKSYLADKEHRYYRGRYHTDHTLPSTYFEAGAERPTDVGHFQLDFSYLFDKSVSNPDFITMGTGRRIRKAAIQDDARVSRGEPDLVEIASAPRLVDALGKHPPGSDGALRI